MWENLIWAFLFGGPFAVGCIAMGLTPPDFNLTRGCFIAAALVMLARISWWITFEHSSHNRITFILSLSMAFLFVGLVLASGLWWVTDRELLATAPREIKGKPQDQASKERTQPTTTEIAKETIKKAPEVIPESKETGPPTFREKAEQRILIEKPEEVTVSLGGGGVTSSISYSQLESRGSVEPINTGGLKPVRIYLDKGRVLADVTLYSDRNKAPIEIKNNEFTVRVMGWDRNYDSEALEVVDNSKSPVFQLIYKTPYQIVINGVFPYPGGITLASDDGTWQFRPPFRPQGFRIHRLFKYSSRQFLGQREENVPIVPKLMLKQRSLQLSNDIMNFADQAQRMLQTVFQRKITSEIENVTMDVRDIYNRQFSVRCVDISNELSASGLDVGSLHSTCILPLNIEAMKEVAEKLKYFSNGLP